MPDIQKTEQDGRQKSDHINSSIKCEWIKYASQKATIFMCYLQEI